MSDNMITLSGMSQPPLSLASLTKLNGSNYYSWVETVGMALELRGLKQAMVSDEVEPTVGLQARFILLESMDENHRAQVRGCNTAKSILDRLKLCYADSSAANVYRLLMQYYRYEKTPEDSISQHVGKMDSMRNQLADLGEKQTDSVYQISLIGSLPAEYASIIEIWELTPPSMRTTQNLIARLLRREEDLKKVSPGGQALAVRQARTKPRMTKEEVDQLKKVTGCAICHKKGHWFKECPQNPENAKANYVTFDELEVGQVSHARDVGEDDEFAFSVTYKRDLVKDNWLADSGASSHMCNDAKWFSTLSNAGSPARFVTVGDGSRIPIHGVGKVRMSAFNGESWTTINLIDVLYVPSLAVNLFSVGSASKRGVDTLFGADCKLMKGGQVLATGGRLGDETYVLHVGPPKTADATAMVLRTDTMGEWHRRLGHVSVDRIKMLLKDLGIKCPEDGSVQCEVCPAGKGKHSTHPSTGARATEPGYVHIDLSGIINKESLKGFRYYMLCKDEATDFDMVYFCKTKSEVPSLLAKLITDFEAIANKPIRTIYSDNGSEFKNSVTDLLFAKEKIQHLTSAPFCPQQNGRIEREIQSIQNMARTMLHASALPLTLWPEAVATAVYIKNRLPNSSCNLTPVERLTKIKPEISHILEFGAPVHLIVNDEYLTKWDARTCPGFMVGFTRKRNTYKVFVPSKNRVIDSSDVIVAPHSTQPTQKTRSENVDVDRVVGVGVNLDVREPATMDTDARTTSQKQSTNSGDTVVEGGGDPSLYGTPLGATMLDKQSTPVEQGKRVCTGPRLDDFFKQYHDEDPIYSEINDQAVYSNQPVYANTSGRTASEREQTVVRPSVPPPQPPCDEENNESEVSHPSYSELTQQSAETGNSDESSSERGTVVETAKVVIGNVDRDVPQTYQQAIEAEDQLQWREAIQSEIKAHHANGTWQTVAKPKNVRMLSTKWVFALKRDAEGNITQHKARLVARGFEQRQGVDFDQTFAPVARLDSIRTLLAIAACKKWHLLQFDVSTAFLNGTIDEDVYIEPPQGLNMEPSACLKLTKALYGLKQAPRAWSCTFSSALEEFGLVHTKTDACVFTDSERSIFCIIYVDDALVMGPDKTKCQRLIDGLAGKFKLKQLNGDCFLGIKITTGEDGIRLSQSRYVADIIARFNMSEAKAVSFPMANAKDLMLSYNGGSSTDELVDNKLYQEAIGCLQYLACSTRPDILFAVNLLARFKQRPRQIHWAAIKRVLKYLKGTPDHCLCYSAANPKIEPRAFSDADYANDEMDRRSISGIVIVIAGGPIIFASRKQIFDVAQSSCEAELIAANEAAKELKWLSQFLSELGVAHKRPTLFIDNKSTISQIKNPDTKRRSKHVDIRYHFVREEFVAKRFDLQHLQGDLQVADLLTKGVNGPTNIRLLDILQCRALDCRL